MYSHAIKCGELFKNQDILPDFPSALRITYEIVNNEIIQKAIEVLRSINFNNQ